MNLFDLEKQYGLPTGMLSAVQSVESGGNPNAVSPAGAIGAFQFMPATAQQYGIDPRDPAQSADGAARYLRDLMQQFGGDQAKALAAYNAGPGRVQRAGGVPNIPETQQYVQKVSERMDPDAFAKKLGGKADAPAMPDPDAVAARLGGKATTSEAGAKGYLGDVLMGLRQPLDAAAEAASRGAAALTNAVAPGSSVDQWMQQQKQSTQDVNAAALADYQQRYKPQERPTAAPLIRGMAQSLPLMAMPMGAASTTLPRMIAQGAGIGAGAGVLEPSYTQGDNASYLSDKAQQAGAGALSGGITSGLLGSASRVIAPEVSDKVKTLLANGVTPTPGQISGGWVKRVEDSLTSVPLLGDAIKAGQNRGIADFNRAIYTRALAPLGPDAVAVAQSAPVGQAGIAKVGDYLSQSYEKALAKSVPSPIDDQFTQGVNNVLGMVPTAKREDFVNALKREIFDKVTPAGTLTPSVSKDAESALGTLVRQYKGSENGDHQVFADAVAQVQTELRGLVARNNPDIAPIIQATNKGWANLTQLENAGAMLGAAKNDGVVSPAQYMNAVKRGDKSVRDRAFARGQAMNQDLAQAGDGVLSNKVNDSGTPLRTMAALAAGGGLTMLHPMAAVGAGAAMLPYTSPGQSAMAALLARRPDLVNQFGEGMRQAVPYLTAPASAGLLGVFGS